MQLSDDAAKMPLLLKSPAVDRRGSR